MNMQHVIASKLIKLNNYEPITISVQELDEPENIEVTVEEQIATNTLKITFKPLSR